MTPRSRQFPLALPHRPSLTRADLIVTPANRAAAAAVDAWPRWPHPILFVVGPEGSGKSHLAAVWAERAEAEAFAGEVPERRPFAVAIDGIERFAGEEQPLFDLMNSARLGGGTVLATARVAPTELAFRLPDLRSRLKAAVAVTIGPPDDALVAGVLAKLFADRQIELDARLLDYILPRMERSLAAAGRLVERIDRETLAAREKVTRAAIRRIMEPDDGGSRDDADDAP